MKPTTTNCHACWADDRRETPATWVTKDAEFLCDAHFRAEGLDPMRCTPIEKWREEHGLAIRERKGENMPRGIPKTAGALCCVCKSKRLRKDSVGGMCRKCRLNAEAPTQETSITSPRRARLVKVARRNNGGTARLLMSPKGQQISGDVVATSRMLVDPSEKIVVELRVDPAWLEVAWERLDQNQKARALAAVLAE